MVLTVNSKDSYHRMPLSLPARHGHEGVVRLLLTRDDVDVNSKNEYGRTPLSLAAIFRHEGVKLLVARDDVDFHREDD